MCIDYADKSNSRHHEQQVLDSVTLTVDGSTAAEFSFIPVEDGDASDAVAAAAWAEAERQSEALVEHTQNEVQNGVQNLTESGSGAPQYEVVTVRGMSVSDEGFCVILQQQQQQQQGRVTPSPTPRRCVRVLVTPEDPMSDGLDHDEVESSEAVTLLQLLQGIDVETYLSKDALATKFSAALHSKNGGSVSKYDLKAVLLNDVGRGKEFQAALAGSLRAPGNHSTTSSSSNGFTSDSTSTALDASNIGNRTAEGFSTTAEQPKKASKRQQHSADDSDMSSEAPSVDVYSSGFGIILPGAPIMLGTPTAENESITSASTSATTSFSSSTSPSSAGAGGAGAGSGKSTFDVEVPIESSFYAIALALRHQVPIEVRCELLQDDRKSFPEQELDTLFPKLLATTAPAAPSGSFAGGTQSQSPVQQQQQQAQMQMQAQAHNKEGKDVKEVKEGKRPSLENLKKRLAEAIRQRNEEKIAQLQESISDFVTSATATATAGLGAAGGMPELPELATH